MSITLPAITRGATSQLIPVRFQDLSLLNGAGKTGLTTSSFTSVYYYRGLAASPVQIALDGTMVAGTWKTGGFVEVSSANQPGEYQIGLPNLAVGTADASPYLTIVFVPTAASGAPQVEIVIPLVAFDLQTATQSVSVTQWNGTNVSSPATAGIPDVNVKNINNVSASSVTTVNANQGTTQPENFTGTGASALVKVDAIDWASGAIPAPAVTGVPKTDLVYILGTLLTETAGQIAAGFKKFFNIAAPAATMDHGVLVDTATTAVNLTNAPTNGDFTTAMKSSLNASTPASVTTVTGNVAGSIGSLAAQAKTDVAGAVLNAVAASYNVAGSIGALINTISSIDVSGVPAAVWNYLVSSLGATTTVGGWFNSLLVAIKAKTDTIGAATITVVSGVVSTQSLVFVLGNDYLVADGRQWDFIYSGYPSFLGGSAVLNLTPLGNVDNLLFTLTGEIYDATTIRFEPTHIETGSATLVASVGTERSMQFLLEIKVTLSDGSVITPTPLGLGRATVYSYAQ